MRLLVVDDSEIVRKRLAVTLPALVQGIEIVGMAPEHRRDRSATISCCRNIAFSAKRVARDRKRSPTKPRANRRKSSMAAS